MNEIRQLSIKKTSRSRVNQSFLLREPAFSISWTLLVVMKFSDSRRVCDQNAALCCLLAEPTSLGTKKQKSEEKFQLEVVSY